mmetsp:Transcript_11119/g.19021  ORF Transcript_11119/g.19021 Transcript_11119/m.19021 type:complete len:104 (+) Transcript_11119:81-392(+)|eukprot:CAMPEP_0184691310 /NCGR_PEP_ID=MMETSP0313-20130426/212_1 /TAXON_ID=2792 /ORGANISM="Porphyridium aerugineum, Strain SAG 1380-2" /LENGTH=103 /DNA_ID=CAMNT_0027149003 /DNA_START=61 /DNA_END=372 /DNA_ORIENTATION=+
MESQKTDITSTQDLLSRRTSAGVEAMATTKTWAFERMGRSHDRVLVDASQRKAYRRPDRVESLILQETRKSGNFSSPVATPRKNFAEVNAVTKLSSMNLERDI